MTASLFIIVISSSLVSSASCDDAVVYCYFGGTGTPLLLLMKTG